MSSKVDSSSLSKLEEIEDIEDPTDEDLNDEEDNVKEEPQQEPVLTGKIADLKMVLTSKIIPNSIVPMAVSNSMLFVGVHERPNDCEFPLSEYLIVAGTVALLISVVGILFRYIINWILKTKAITKVDHVILVVLEVVGNLISLLEVALFIAGGVYVFPHVDHVQFEDKSKPFYCDRVSWNNQ